MGISVGKFEDLRSVIECRRRADSGKVAGIAAVPAESERETEEREVESETVARGREVERGAL